MAEALANEETAHREALADHEQRVIQGRLWAAFATRVLAGDLAAYQEAVEGTGCLDELTEVLGADAIRVRYDLATPVVELRVAEDAVVPAEGKALTARGAVSEKKLAAGARFEIYQDYVCGAALRAGRELLAVLPVRGVLVHVHAPLLDRATGHFVPTTILSVYCPREAMDAVNWERADASDLTERLHHAMKLARGKSFAAVERLAVPG